jgi:hypothetical protein
MLDQTRACNAATWDALDRAHEQTRSAGEDQLARMPRDSAWTQFHEALAGEGLKGTFHKLYVLMRATWGPATGGTRSQTFLALAPR